MNTPFRVVLEVVLANVHRRSMQRFLTGVSKAVIDGNGWKKLANPTVSRGKTAWPKLPAEQARYGIRYDYDGEIEIDGVKYNKFQMQPNAGDDVPSTIKNWRNKMGGTHAVMAALLVPKDGDKDAVKEALEKANEEVTGV